MNVDDDDDAFNDQVFELQASLVTMQAEVTQYQKQNQQQQATIRQLQNEISQANLQRQLMQEKLQKQQQQATSWQHLAPMPAAPPLPPAVVQQPQEHQETVVANNNVPISRSPSKSPAKGESSKKAAHSSTTAGTTTTETTTTTSLGMFLCRTVLLSPNNGNHHEGTAAAAAAPLPQASVAANNERTMRMMVWQKMQPEQDESLLQFLVQHALAYLQRQVVAAATDDSPLPWLYYALVFAQGKMLKNTSRNIATLETSAAAAAATTTTTTRPLRLRLVNHTTAALALPEKHSGNSLLQRSISAQLLAQTFQAVAAHGRMLLLRQEGHLSTLYDLLYVFRLLALPVFAKMDWNHIIVGDDHDNFGTLLWQWVIDCVNALVTAPPQAPRRYVSTASRRNSCRPELEHLTAALYLGRLHCAGDKAAAASISTVQPWIRSFVAVTSDWLHFVLLPCFALYRRQGDDPDKDINLLSGNDNSTLMDERVSLACELIQCWQSLFGVDSDWLRTQLALPTDQASSSGRITHGNSMLQLACRLLQAIALEEGSNNQLEKSHFRALQDCLLRFLAPIVARHATWLDTSSRLEYTSALARLKAQHQHSENGLLVQACWDGARADPAVVGGG